MRRTTSPKQGQNNYLSRRHLYDNGFNFSNFVPPQHILRSKLHPSFPILYLPEYIGRRLNEKELATLKGDKKLVELFDVYSSYIEKYRKNRQLPAIDENISDDYITTQILVRVIIIPTSTHLISKVNTLIINDDKNDVEDKSFPITASTDRMNPYLKTRGTYSESKNRQTLESLVDDIVSSLVRSHSKSNVSKKTSSSRNNTTKLKYRNLLCEGYRLMNDGYIKHPGKREKTIPVAHSQTLGLGIQVTHPNTCVSYAKSDPVIKHLHRLIGDDLLREIMMNSIILIPIGDFDKCPSDLTFGNYFQLCGPPLSNFTTSTIPDFFIATNHLSKMKRKSYDDGYPQSKRMCIRKIGVNETSFDLTLLMVTHFIIPRHRILYCDSFLKTVGLPPRHILMKKTPGHSLILLKSVFPVDRLIMSTKGVRRRWNVIHKVALNIIEQIIKNNTNINYKRRLEQACPLKSFYNKEVPLQDLVQLSSSKDRIGSFLVGIIKALFPSTCWGSTRNFDVIAKNVRLFVCLRRQENISISAIMKGIKISEIRWLNPEGGKKHLDRMISIILVQHLLKWLFCDFIIPLIRSTFYVTVTEFTGDEVNYYRKPLWSKIRKLSLRLLTEKQFTQLRDHNLNKNHRSSLGCSQLRILPKVNGIRPIALLCKVPRHVIPDTSEFWAHRSINSALQDSFDVLTQEYKEQPSLFGIGVAGVSELHKRLIAFMEDLRCSASKKLYFVSVDIHKCFDNINQDYLLSLLDEIFRRDEYIIQERMLLRYAVDEALVRHEKKKHVSFPCSTTTSITSSTAILQNKKASVLIGQSKCSFRSKSHLLEIISQHLKYNIVVVKGEFGPTFYRQTKGIAQGSVLSTLLCNFYYGNIEKQLMNEVFTHTMNEKARFIARVVDDFLLITSNYYEAIRFQRHLESGYENLGVKINASKTKTSHKTPRGHISLDYESLVTICDVNFFPWCGYLFNIETMEVHIDYSRFESSCVTESLRIERVKNEGQSFRKRLRTFYAPRCQPILFDPRINSWESLCINFYQASAFAAVKCARYIQIGGLSDGVDKNVNFVANAISELFDYAFERISRSLSRAEENSYRIYKTKEGMHDVITWLKKAEAIWLGYFAFLNIFEAHSDFKKLIYILRKKQKHSTGANVKLVEIGVQGNKMFNSRRFFNA